MWHVQVLIDMLLFFSVTQPHTQHTHTQHTYTHTHTHTHTHILTFNFVFLRVQCVTGSHDIRDKFSLQTSEEFVVQV